MRQQRVRENEIERTVRLRDAIDDDARRSDCRTRWLGSNDGSGTARYRNSSAPSDGLAVDRRRVGAETPAELGPQCAQRRNRRRCRECSTRFTMPSLSANIRNARVHQKCFGYEDAIADADADPQVIGRQRAKFREDKARHHVAGIHRCPEQRIEGQFRGRREELAEHRSRLMPHEDLDDPWDADV